MADRKITETAETDRKTEITEQVMKMQDNAVAFCYAVLHDFHESEDAFQEAAMTAVRRADQFRGGDAGKWFWKILRNVVGTRIRSRKHTLVQMDSPLIDAMSDSFEERNAGSGERGEVDRLMECMEELPARARTALELRFLEGLKCTEIASRLKTTIEAAYSLIKRAKELVEKCMGNENAGTAQE